MNNHFIKVCKYCDTVITQCKCPGPNKTKEFGICWSCAQKNQLALKVEAKIEGLFYGAIKGFGADLYTAVTSANTATANQTSKNILEDIKAMKEAIKPFVTFISLPARFKKLFSEEDLKALHCELIFNCTDTAGMIKKSDGSKYYMLFEGDKYTMHHFKGGKE